MNKVSETNNKHQNKSSLISQNSKFSGNNPSSKIKYIKMNGKIDRILKMIISSALKFHTISYVIFYLLRTIIDYCIFNLGDQSYHLFYLTLWPFNQKTPIGYLISLAIEFTTVACSQIWFIPTAAFFIGLCWFSIAFANDVRSDLNFLNIGGTSHQRQAQLMKRFCGIVQLYADARQLRQ